MGNEQSTLIKDDSKRRIGTAATTGLTSWRSKISWRSKSGDDGKHGRDGAEETLSWRSKSSFSDAKSRKPRVEEPVVKTESRSALSALKKNTPQLQWRSIINKFTPEKFDKLCDQLLAT